LLVSGSMNSTDTNLFVHVVFSTKEREKLIDPQWENRLHQYLGGTINGLKAAPLGVGGVADHVHLLISIGSTPALADIVRDIKRSSSGWIRETVGQKNFAWQKGYGAFSVSASQRSKVREYIERQAEHHRQKSFREELIELLDKSGVKYDPKYMQ